MYIYATLYYNLYDRNRKTSYILYIVFEMCEVYNESCAKNETLL